MTPSNNAFGMAWPTGGQIFRDGTQLSGGAFTVAVRVVNGVLYAQDAKGHGWFTVTSDGTWTSAPGDPGPATTLPTGGQPNNSATSGCPLVTQLQAPGPADAPTPPATPPVQPSSPTPTAAVTTVQSGGGCQDTTVVPGAVTPGVGSFSGAAGIYAVDATNGDVASLNGVPINSGAYQTSQLAQGSDGNIYGQDENSHQWFELMGSGADTWWQPLSSLPPAIMPAGPISASATANPCAGVLPQNATGPLNPVSGVLPNILQTCADPATVANPMNADLCSKAFANQAMLDQISAQLAAQQAGAK
jgi:hypothetical protein